MKDSETHEWVKRPHRILDYVFNPVMDEIPVADIVAYCRRLHADVIHFHCQDNMHGGFDEHGIYFTSRYAKRKNRDILGEFLPVAREAGLKTVVYVNLHWYTRAFADLHPDWRVITRDGSPFCGLYGDDDSTFCINSPWREWSFGLLEDLCAYPIDGIFFDGPITFATRGGCFCEHCQAKYRSGGYESRLGHPFPDASEATGSGGRVFHEFHVDSMIDYYHDAVETIRAARPEAVVYGNYANVSEAGWTAGRCNRRLINEMDALLAEGGFMYGRPDRKLLFKTGASSRLYETQAGAKPACNAVSMAYSPWRWISLSGAETAVLLAQASIGVDPYYAVFYPGRNAPGPEAAAKRYAFLETWETELSGMQSAARVAVLHSDATLNHYHGVDIPWADLSYQSEQRSEEIGNFTRSFYGCYELLLRGRVAFDIIDDWAVEQGGLDRYDTLILPNCACLGDTACAAIEQFIQAGGSVIADFETAFYDDHGLRRKQSGLASLFGFVASDRVSEHRRWDYVFATDPAKSLLPAPRRNIPGIVSERAVVEGWFSESIPSNIVAETAASDQPFLVSNRSGSGRSWYFPCQFTEFYGDAHPEGFPELLSKLVSHSPDHRYELRDSGEAPHLIDFRPRIRPDGNACAVHLTNLETGPIDRVIPARGLEVVVPDTGYQRVRALVAGKELPLVRESGYIKVRLDRLEAYEVLLAE